MWFEILPSFFIVTTALSIPTFALYGIHKMVLGNPYRRNLDQRFDRAMFMRDWRLTGDPYKMNGLEAVSEECEEDEKYEKEDNQKEENKKEDKKKEKNKKDDKCPPKVDGETAEQKARKDIEKLTKEKCDQKECELKVEDAQKDKK